MLTLLLTAKIARVSAARSRNHHRHSLTLIAPNNTEPPSYLRRASMSAPPSSNAMSPMTALTSVPEAPVGQPPSLGPIVALTKIHPAPEDEKCTTAHDCGAESKRPMSR